MLASIRGEEDRALASASPSSLVVQEPESMEHLDGRSSQLVDLPAAVECAQYYPLAPDDDAARSVTEIGRVKIRRHLELLRSGEYILALPCRSAVCRLQ